MATRLIGSSVSLTISQRMAAAMAALMLGSFLVWGVGLAHSQALHDAAHDTRHTYGFPCH